MTKHWREVRDGYAEGPAEVVAAGPAEVRIQALWTDTEGVCLSIDGGEEPLPVVEVARVCAALLAMSTLDGPR